MNTTTRKFARTMDEAFPFGAEYGAAITKYSRHDGHRWIVPASLLAAVALVVIFAMERF